MTVTDDFKNAVLEGNIIGTRIMLKDSILLNPDGRNFSQMFEFAKENMPNLVDEHNGEVFRSEDGWDEDYLNKQMVIVVNNFSNERIELLLKMVKKLYSVKDSSERGEVVISYPDSREKDGNSIRVLIIVIAIILVCLVIIGVVVL